MSRVYSAVLVERRIANGLFREVREDEDDEEDEDEKDNEEEDEEDEGHSE